MSMTRRSPDQPSGETIEAAQQMAKAIQKPGQTKEQTKLIAQGIQKGIELYKKQQKVKARELDKKLKQVKRQVATAELATDANQPQDAGQAVGSADGRGQRLLPWGLLLLSWLAFGAFLWLQ